MSTNLEEASWEIELLLTSLHVQVSNHKKRLKSLKRFHDFVSNPGDGRVGFEESTGRCFYDDDVLTLFTGRKPYGSFGAAVCGLLLACGEQSSSFTSSSSPRVGRSSSLEAIPGPVKLKRSAFHAIRLLFFLVFEARVDDWEENSDNVFLETFVNLNENDIASMNLPSHLADGEDGDKSRSGSRMHASALVLLLLSRRGRGFSESSREDGNHLVDGDRGSLTLKDIIPGAALQQSYLAWLRKFQIDQARWTKFERTEMLKSQETPKDPEWVNVCRTIYPTIIRGGECASESQLIENPSGSGVDRQVQIKGSRQSDQQGADKKSDDPIGHELGLHSPDILSLRGAPTVWGDSHVATVVKANSSMDFMPEDAMKLQATGEIVVVKSDEERSQILSCDPLGIRPSTFDLRTLETGRQKVLFEDSMNQISPSSRKDITMSREGSVLPTDANFSPLLFLSLVHPNASFDELTKALARLEKVADNHAMRLQQLVRDNFPLFVRCAEGIDWFSENIGGAVKGEEKNSSTCATPRLERLGSLVDRTVHHANGAFRPLLDSTSEVRMTKNALAILSRVGPILSVPNLMTTHLEAGRVAEAVKAYRRVKLINDSCGVELLKSVRDKAMEAASEARSSLVKLLASPEASTNQLLGAVCDMRDLDELDNDELFEDGSRSSLFSPQGRDSLKDARVRNPALLCLEAQIGHFSKQTLESIKNCDALLLKSIASEEGDDSTRKENQVSEVAEGAALSVTDNLQYFIEDESKSEEAFEKKFGGGHASLKASVYSTRVTCCYKASSLVTNWLPRLMRVASVAHGIESQRPSLGRTQESDRMVISFLEEQVCDTISILLDMAGRCSVGNDQFETEMTQIINERKLTEEQKGGLNARSKCCRENGATIALAKVDFYTSPLPPGFNTKCTSSLSKLAEAIAASAVTARGLEGFENLGFPNRSKNGRLDIAKATELEISAEIAVRYLVACEKRWCSNALGHCAKICGMAATSRRVLDVPAVSQCIQKLGVDLHRGFECGVEIEAGVLNCMTTICANLREASKEGSIPINLSIVRECSKALQYDIDVLVDVIGGVGSSVSGSRAHELGEKCTSCVEGLEKKVWGSYVKNLEEITRGGFLNVAISGIGHFEAPFPPKLANVLMHIIRSRALVEVALPPASTKQTSSGKSYRRLAMEAACESLLITVRELKLPSKESGEWKDAVCHKSVQLAYLVEILKDYVSPAEVKLARDVLQQIETRVAGIDLMLRDLRYAGKAFTLCFGNNNCR